MTAPIFAIPKPIGHIHVNCGVMLIYKILKIEITIKYGIHYFSEEEKEHKTSQDEDSSIHPLWTDIYRYKYSFKYIPKVFIIIRKRTIVNCVPIVFI